MYTPQEFSRLKYDRECKMQETAKAFRLQVLQQQKVISIISSKSKADLDKAQKAAQQSGQPPGAHGMPPGRHSSLGVPIGTSPNMGLSVPNTHPQAGPANLVRPTPPLPRIMAESQQNGGLSAPGNPQGVPHAPMQSHPMQSRVPPQMTSNIYHEATRVQQEQQRYLAQQRQQQHPQSTVQPSNSASPNLGNPKLMSQSNSGMIVGLQGQSGSPSINGAPTPTGSSSSPRMTTPSQPQSLSSGVVPTVSHISNQIKTHNPLASPEQITKMTTERLNAFRNQAQVAAMQAAAGTNAAAAAGNTNINNLPHQQQPIMNGVGANTGMINPQQYAQMMRNHQSNQQNRNNVNAINGVRSGSQGATPQAHRSGSAQAGPPPSQSPLPVQAQMAGGQ